MRIRVALVTKREKSVVFQELLARAAPELHVTTLEEAGTAGADVVLGDPASVVAAVRLGLTPRFVQSTWAGVEELLPVVRKEGFRLCNVRGIFEQQMGEWALAYLLAHERRLLQRMRMQEARKWSDSPPSGSVFGRTLGLLGLGSIGGGVAQFLGPAFKMKVLGWSRTSKGGPHVSQVFHGQEGLMELARCSDYVLSVLPETPSTKGVLSDKFFAALKDGAVFLNGGRGSAVDENALIPHLRAKRLFAVLDVVKEEPLSPNSPLWDIGAPHLILTHHTAAVTEPADVVPIFLENLKRYLAGEELLYEVLPSKGY